MWPICKNYSHGIERLYLPLCRVAHIVPLESEGAKLPLQSGSLAPSDSKGTICSFNSKYPLFAEHFLRTVYFLCITYFS